MSKEIENLEDKVKGAKVLLKKYEKAKNTKMISRIKDKIERDENKIAELKKKDKKTDKPEKSKSMSISGSLSKEKCIEFLNQLAKDQGIERKKKNIASGRADSSGSLKVSASLENEAESIEKKTEKGQTLNKTDQKKVGVNIDKIMTECVKMIKTKKDSEALIRDLISSLQSLLSDIKAGKIEYEG